VLAFKEAFTDLMAGPATTRRSAKVRSEGRQGRRPDPALRWSPPRHRPAARYRRRFSQPQRGRHRQCAWAAWASRRTERRRPLPAPTGRFSGGVGPRRTDEEIQIVFDRSKGRSPDLQPRTAPQSVAARQDDPAHHIEPGGEVSACRVEFDRPGLGHADPKSLTA